MIKMRETKEERRYSIQSGILERRIEKATKRKREYLEKKKEFETYISNIEFEVRLIDTYINEQRQRLRSL